MVVLSPCKYLMHSNGLVVHLGEDSRYTIGIDDSNDSKLVFHVRNFENICIFDGEVSVGILMACA